MRRRPLLRIVFLSATIACTAWLPRAVGQQACQPYLDLEDFYRRKCLSGRSLELSAGVEGALDVLKRAIKGELSLGIDEREGAYKKLSDEFYNKEQDAVRECYKPLLDKVLHCIEEEIEIERKQRTDGFPPEVLLQFSLQFIDHQNPNLHPSHVILGLKSPPRLRPQRVLKIEDGWYNEEVATPRAKHRIQGFIRREPVSAVRELPNATALCLKRSVHVPQSGRRSLASRAGHASTSLSTPAG